MMVLLTLIPHVDITSFWPAALERVVLPPIFRKACCVCIPVGIERSGAILMREAERVVSTYPEPERPKLQRLKGKLRPAQSETFPTIGQGCVAA